MERSGGIGEWDAHHYLFSQKKKKEKLLCALARYPIFPSEECYCRYNYISISPPIEYLVVSLKSVVSIPNPTGRRR